MNLKCPVAARWQRKKEARPAEILDAALDLFVEKGFSATRMEEIARRAGVTKGTPYLYFSGKEDIFKAMINEFLLNPLGTIQETVSARSGSRADLLHELMEIWWHKVASRKAGGLCKLMIAEAANFPELTRYYHDELIQPGKNLVARIIRAGIDSGEFRDVPVDDAAEMLLAPALMTMIDQHSFLRAENGLPSSPADPLRYLHFALDMMLTGLNQPSR
ncbi:TetR/AcrR family transcriptional regulator [Paludibacterium paludis]|uniref:TetR family transcriptional regulator n=1 Tax=Paludibacterium paludis TaxID=1225769 RepID=A0A918NZ62_9NEIS|nr:TetR/AcrR family transcriptional regulator [Paludibacterium paludis]GGY08654.1 TetR family transcriptional regulator [Paludibacterium paludis]